jgi:hypothetical protein
MTKLTQYSALRIYVHMLQKKQLYNALKTRQFISVKTARIRNYNIEERIMLFLLNSFNFAQACHVIKLLFNSIDSIQLHSM